MFIKRFEVAGFKNLVQPVVLDDLDPISVIHGDNNVGKSNVLEALHFFFGLISPTHVKGHVNLDERTAPWLHEPEIERFGYSLARIFNVYDPRPIEMQCVVATTAVEREAGHIEVDPRFDEVTIAIRAWLEPSGASYCFSRFEYADGTRFPDLPTGDDQSTATKFLAFIAQTRWRQDRDAKPSFALVDENRAIRGLTVDAPGGILSPDLQLRLYKLSASRDAGRTRRWRLFRRLIEGVVPNLPPGHFDVIYDIEAQRAALVYDTADARLDADLLGSGVQQIAALLGQILTTDASVVAIEEPELNLRYPLQVLVRDLLREIVADPAGPEQLLITSHSPAFEVSDTFFGMHLDDDGVPRIARRPKADAPRYTGMPDDMPMPPTADKAGRSYVTGDGLVEVPPFVLEALDLPQGGGVFFAVRKDDRIVEMLSHAQFLKLGGYDDDDR